MTHVRSHRREPWNEMAGSLAEAAMTGCCVPSSRTELERWMMSFGVVPVGAVWTCAAMQPRCEGWKNIFEELKDSPWVNEEPKDVRALRIATLNVLTFTPAEEREANGLRIPARQARLASTFEDAGIEVIGLQECRTPAQLEVREGFVMVTSEAEDGRDEDGITTEVLGAGGRPMAQLLQPLFASVRLQRALPIVWRRSIMATIPSGKNKTRGVMLNDHVGKILERWTKDFANRTTVGRTVAGNWFGSA